MKEKGPLHVRLQQLLHAAWKRKELKQDSLGVAIGQSQENAGQYLRGQRAGALDLDESAAALKLIGSSLPDFIVGVEPPAPSRGDLIARRLVGRPDLHSAVEALLEYPRPRLGVILGEIDAVFFAATGRRLGLFAEWESETKRAARTKSAPRKRR